MKWNTRYGEPNPKSFHNIKRFIPATVQIHIGKSYDLLQHQDVNIVTNVLMDFFREVTTDILPCNELAEEFGVKTGDTKPAPIYEEPKMGKEIVLFQISANQRLAWKYETFYETRYPSNFTRLFDVWWGICMSEFLQNRNDYWIWLSDSCPIFHRRVCENKNNNSMDAKELAVIWGPCLFQRSMGKSPIRDMRYYNRFVRSLIEHYFEIFE